VNATAPALPAGSPRAALLLMAAVLVWSGIGPAEPGVWAMEVCPVLVGGAAVLLRWRAFPLTPLAVWVVALFSVVICVGGHYTYALVPAGAWVQDAFDLSRNHYDRLGHFLQGVTPAVLARELLLRCTGLVRGKALFWSAASIALAISAMYEILEWWSALIVDPEAGIAFLGSQGDVWDAQWDMSLALGGAILVQLVFGRLHDRQLERIDPSCGEGRVG
jgi:putative membrane protein